MRALIASFVALIFGYAETAFAQATKPSEIRVTQRTDPLGVGKIPPLATPPECRVLNRPNMVRPPHPVYCGVVPSAPNWSSQAPTLTYEQQMQAAKRGFAALDLNHDGVISRKEWSAMQARLVAPVPPHGRVQLMCETDQVFKLMDRNYDGKITLGEFTADNFGRDRQPIRGCY